MNTEIQSIITNYQQTLFGEPWYGKSIMAILEEVHPANAYINPKKSHAAIELLYHMITWASFTLHRLEKLRDQSPEDEDALDWREIDPTIHTWENGLREFKEIHQQILQILTTKKDIFLSEKVDYRKYDFRFLLNGLIQHNIYHAGQIAYLNKQIS